MSDGDRKIVRLTDADVAADRKAGEVAATMKGKVHLKKQCKCIGASSGPRKYAQRQQVRMPNGSIRNNLLLGFAPLACDVCDLPWVWEIADMERKEGMVTTRDRIAVMQVEV